MNPRKLIYAGLSIAAASFLLGAAGALYFVYDAFFSLAAARNAGLGAVGGAISYGVATTVVSLVGMVAGVVLMVAGVVKSKRPGRFES